MQRRDFVVRLLAERKRGRDLPQAVEAMAESATLPDRMRLLLLAEPSGHVKPEEFNWELEAARTSGFEVVDRLVVRGSLAAALRKLY